MAAKRLRTSANIPWDAMHASKLGLNAGLKRAGTARLLVLRFAEALANA